MEFIFTSSHLRSIHPFAVSICYINLPHSGELWAIKLSCFGWLCLGLRAKAGFCALFYSAMM